MKLAGTVVLYNPDISVIDNIRTYIDEIDLLIIVDNSEIQNKKLLSKLKKYGNKIQLISFGENLGIAKALNTAARLAVDKGYSHLLTMDQDSSFDKINISYLKNTAIKNKKMKFAVIAPVFSLKTEHVKRIRSNSGILDDVKSVITSGCILNLEAFNSAGGFCDKLFIDQVDHEFSLRARKKGYKTYILRDCFLNHNLGESVNAKFLFFKTRVTNHNYIRRYYMTRNGLYLAAHYWNKIPETIRKMTADIFKMIIFENDRIKKLRSVVLGIFDFIRCRYGKYDY